MQKQSLDRNIGTEDDEVSDNYVEEKLAVSEERPVEDRSCGEEPPHGQGVVKMSRRRKKTRTIATVKVIYHIKPDQKDSF